MVAIFIFSKIIMDDWKGNVRSRIKNSPKGVSVAAPSTGLLNHPEGKQRKPFTCHVILFHDGEHHASQTSDNSREKTRVQLVWWTASLRQTKWFIKWTNAVCLTSCNPTAFLLVCKTQSPRRWTKVEVSSVYTGSKVELSSDSKDDSVHNLRTSQLGLVGSFNVT